MDKNLILFKSGEGIIEVYNTLFSFTEYVGCIHFQITNNGLFIGWNNRFRVILSPDSLRAIADIMEELYKNKDLIDQIGVKING